MNGGADGESTPKSEQPKLGRYDTAPGENTIPVKGTSKDREILEILRNSEMTDKYDVLSPEVKTLLVEEAINKTIEEDMELYSKEDFNTKEILYIITDLINEGNNPPADLMEVNMEAHR